MANTNRLVFLTGLLFFTLSTPSSAADWYELESPHFIMYTNARENTARKLFNELEGFRILVLNFVNFDIPPDAEKVKIILFKNNSDFKKYTWSSEIAGFTVPTKTSAIIVQPAYSGSLDSTNIIYHEYVHTLLRHYNGRLPGWFNEGLAELFGATRYRGNKFQVGTAPKHRLESFVYGGGNLASFDDIVADKFQTHRSGSFQDPYVQYWMLADYFEFGNKERKKDLEFYLLLFNDGMDSLKAFQTAFKKSPEELWKTEIKKYFSRGKIPALRIGIPPEQLAFPVTREEADMTKVTATLRVLKANSAAAAFATKDYRRGRKLFQELVGEIDPDNRDYLGMINNYVWLLATSPDDRIRDGKEALRLGEMFIKGKTDDPGYLDTLAAAYAEAGSFDEAVQLQSELVSRLDESDRNYAGFARRLAKYKNNEPWRDEEDN